MISLESPLIGFLIPNVYLMLDRVHLVTSDLFPVFEDIIDHHSGEGTVIKLQALSMYNSHDTKVLGYPTVSPLL